MTPKLETQNPKFLRLPTAEFVLETLFRSRTIEVRPV
jgi:hypothetical protein